MLAGLRDLGAVLSELAHRRGAGHRSAGRRSTRPLHTERLTLRPATADDADATWKFRRLDVRQRVADRLPRRPRGLPRAVRRAARLATTVIVTLGHDAAAPIIGDLMLRREDAWAQPEVADQARGTQAELGWVLDPAYTGHGYATEAVRELLRYCFQDLGVRRVIANCFLDNDTSWRLMERVGMRRELHAVRESLHRSGRWLDTVGYAISRRGVVADLSDGVAHTPDRKEPARSRR